MKQVRGWWVPDADEHIERYFSKMLNPATPMWVYQPRQQMLVHELIRERNRGMAVDVGAHVGLWARYFTQAYVRTVCFEPIAENRECLVRNAPLAEIMPYALFDQPGSVRLRQMAEDNGKISNSGAWTVRQDGTERVQCRTLDWFGLSPDLVKIDVQDGAGNVLLGAEETLRRCLPLVVLEENVEDEPNQFLLGLGYGRIAKEHRDGVYAVAA